MMMMTMIANNNVVNDMTFFLNPKEYKYDISIDRSLFDFVGMTMIMIMIMIMIS